MDSMSKIKTAIERTVKVIEHTPSVGRVTKKATARMVDGLKIEVREGEFKLISDMPEVLGGSNAGPSPGAFARMSLGACLVVGYAMWLSREEVPFEDIDVEVEGDQDQAGMLGVKESASPGHDSLRVKVNITSQAPQAEIERVIDLADRHSPILHLVTKPVPVTRELNLMVPAAEPVAVAT
ncbi:MAG: OsmC family protein [bacterium]